MGGWWICAASTGGSVIQCSDTSYLVGCLPDERVTAKDATYTSGAIWSELDEHPVVSDDQSQQDED